MQMGHSSWAKLGLVTRLKNEAGVYKCQECVKVVLFKIENEPGVDKYVKSVSKFCHYKIKNEGGMYK